MLCPDGKEPLTKLIHLVATRRMGLSPLVTHISTQDETATNWLNYTRTAC
jgi:hypothetical protein